MKQRTDQAIIEAYLKAKAMKLEVVFITLLEKEFQRQQLPVPDAIKNANQ